MKSWFALAGVVAVAGAFMVPKTSSAVGVAQGAAQGNAAVQLIPAGQKHAGSPSQKGGTYYALESQTTRLSMKFRDGHVAVAERGLIGDVRTTVRDQNGDERGRLRLTKVDVAHDTLHFEPNGGTAIQAQSDPTPGKSTLDWSARQAYGFAKDGTTNLIWDAGTMRPKGAPRRDLDQEVTELVTTWANGLSATLTRQNFSRRELSKGRFVQGPAMVSELTLNGVAAGLGIWFEQDQVFAYQLPGLTDGLVYIAPEHLKRDYGGWGFTPDPAWVNLQTIAQHHFKTLLVKNGSVARNCAPAAAPSRVAQFFFPTVHAEPGCDGLHWLDGTILRLCCDNHDMCYETDGCTARTWWRVWTSWTCDACNITVVSCFIGGGNPDPRCWGRLVC